MIYVNGSFLERRIFQFEEFRLVNPKAEELLGPETIETQLSAICAPFYCILSWVVRFYFSGGNFVKEADYSRIIIRIPITKDQTQKILSEKKSAYKSSLLFNFNAIFFQRLNAKHGIRKG